MKSSSVYPAILFCLLFPDLLFRHSSSPLPSSCLSVLLSPLPPLLQSSSPSLLLPSSAFSFCYPLPPLLLYLRLPASPPNLLSSSASSAILFPNLSPDSPATLFRLLLSSSASPAESSPKSFRPCYPLPSFPCLIFFHLSCYPLPTLLLSSSASPEILFPPLLLSSSVSCYPLPPLLKSSSSLCLPLPSLLLSSSASLRLSSSDSPAPLPPLLKSSSASSPPLLLSSSASSAILFRLS
ncbi:unnamed protein product [Acanthosepion pharaonis]|uniref:Uncharacterized protein n=1 Tax=Acanthosepion pharaonis TaxID=158019 RepID=A0A812BG41_ACAPH|nr:unnamed protein product [Sepia pharaonis]